jgi:hypothetical protein
MDNMPLTGLGCIVGAIGLPYLIFFHNTTKAQRADYSMPELFYGFLLIGLGGGIGGTAGMLLDIICKLLGIKI